MIGFQLLQPFTDLAARIDLIVAAAAASLSSAVKSSGLRPGRNGAALAGSQVTTGGPPGTPARIADPDLPQGAAVTHTDHPRA